MKVSELTDSVAGLAEVLTYFVPVAVSLAGIFGLAVLVAFSFIRKH